MSDGEKIPNISYLGTCYDVVTMDPLNLGSSSKLQHVIDLEAPGAYLTPDGRFSVPNGVRHEAPLSMSYESQSSVISSAYELQQELKRSVDVEAGVEGAFEFSGSASVKEVEREAGTRKNSFV
jgi:hypothetical protein